MISGKGIQIIETIASGGSAVLYKAVQTSLDRAVAVKKLHAHLTSDPNFTRRFILEAKAAASLDHENIVHVIDFGVEDESYQIVMEYIEGESLKQVIERWTPMPVDFALAVVYQTLLGLEHAHIKGIVHRDIKPGNILLTRYGKIKITDFGLAKLTQAQTQETAADSILGTPLYMSPEQAFGESVDCRSDLFSLGTMLYEMLTGKQPFADENYMGVIQNIINRTVPSPKRFNCELPPAVEAILSRALNKNRDARFQTAADFRLAIEEYLGAARLKELQEDLKSLLFTNGATIALQSSSLAKPVKRKSSKKSYVVAGVFGAVLTAVAVAFFYPDITNKIKILSGSYPDSPQPELDGMKGAAADPAHSGRPFPYEDWFPPEIADSTGVDAPAASAPAFEGQPIFKRGETANAGSVMTDTAGRAEDMITNPGAESVADAQPQQAGSGSVSRVSPAAGANAARPENAAPAGGGIEQRAKPPAKKGWLSITALPTAEIHIDGRYIGDTPPTLSIELASGFHKLECKQPMHEPYIEEIKIINGELSQRNVTLKKLRGQISLAASEGAEVYVDGTLIGITPIMEPITVDAGRHQLILKKAGFNTWSSEVHIQANDLMHLKIVLSPKY